MRQSSSRRALFPKGDAMPNPPTSNQFHPWWQRWRFVMSIPVSLVRGLMRINCAFSRRRRRMVRIRGLSLRPLRWGDLTRRRRSGVPQSSGFIRLMRGCSASRKSQLNLSLNRWVQPSDFTLSGPSPTHGVCAAAYSIFHLNTKSIPFKQIAELPDGLPKLHPPHHARLGAIRI